MKLFARRPTPTEQLKNAALGAALSGLGDDKGESKDKPALTGVRAVAAGAVLYTGGRAAIRGRRFLREQSSSNQGERQDEDAGEPDDGLSSNTATPQPKRKPMRRAARTKGAQPSLKLPQQRWPRMPAARK